MDYSHVGIPARNVFNFDETALIDHPGAKRVLVSRGYKRVERIVDHSKQTFRYLLMYYYGESRLRDHKVFKMSILIGDRILLPESTFAPAINLTTKCQIRERCRYFSILSL